MEKFRDCSREKLRKNNFLFGLFSAPENKVPEQNFLVGILVLFSKLFYGLDVYDFY